MKETISKVTIARMQIEKACGLHLECNYVCALTLAGSSEGLTHEFSEVHGRESGDYWYVKCIRFLREKAGSQSPSTTDILKNKNWARNSVKHHQAGAPEEIKINLEFESFLAIKRSIENYQCLGYPQTDCMELFNERTREYG